METDPLVSPTMVGRLRNVDKRVVVDRMLDDPALGGLSNRALGRRCGVSHELVAQRRAARSGGRCQMGEVRIAERSGRRYAIRVAGINARRSRGAIPGDRRPSPVPRDRLAQELSGDAGLTYQLWTHRLGGILTAAREIVAQWDAARDDLRKLQRQGRLAEGRVRSMQGVMARTARLMRFHLVAIEKSVPFALCPGCSGVELGCPDCGGVGWVDRDRHAAIVRRGSRRGGR